MRLSTLSLILIVLCIGGGALFYGPLTNTGDRPVASQPSDPNRITNDWMISGFGKIGAVATEDIKYGTKFSFSNLDEISVSSPRPVQDCPQSRDTLEGRRAGRNIRKGEQICAVDILPEDLFKWTAQEEERCSSQSYGHGFDRIIFSIRNIKKGEKISALYLAQRDTVLSAVPMAALKSVREAHGKLATHDINCGDTLTRNDVE